MQLDTALQKCGLSFKEARIYQAVLEIGPARTLAISQKANLKRTTTYEILKNLEAKGIITSQLRNRRKYFFISSPERLKNVIHEQKNIINEITPFIVEQFNKRHGKVKIQMFEGKDGIEDIFKDTLKCKSKKIHQYTSVQKFIESPGEPFMRWYVKERVKLKIQNYALCPNNKKENTGSIFGSTNPKYLREARYIDLFFTNFICIYDNKVAMTSEAENFGFIIESKDFSRIILDWFWFLWNSAKEKPDK